MGNIVYLGSATPNSGSGGGSGNAVWGAITGTLSDQTDLQTALDAKQNTLTAGSNITINNGTISATNTTDSNFVGATSSVAGSAGLVPAPTTSDVNKYLKGNGTWATVSSGGLQNTATGTNSLTILGTATNATEAINVGKNTTASGHSVAVGVGAISAFNSVAVGNGAKNASGASVAIGGGYEENDNIYERTETTGDHAIAIGCNTKASQSSTVIGTYATTGSYTNCIVLGTLATASDNNSFWVGSYRNPYTSQTVSYKLMDLSTGKIPNDRINVDANPTQNSTNFVTSGTIYSVLGNINTLLAAI